MKAFGVLRVCSVLSAFWSLTGSRTPQVSWDLSTDFGGVFCFEATTLFLWVFSVCAWDWCQFFCAVCWPSSGFPSSLIYYVLCVLLTCLEGWPLLDLYSPLLPCSSHKRRVPSLWKRKELKYALFHNLLGAYFLGTNSFFHCILQRKDFIGVARG